MLIASNTRFSFYDLRKSDEGADIDINIIFVFDCKIKRVMACYYGAYHKH